MRQACFKISYVHRTVCTSRRVVHYHIRSPFQLNGDFHRFARNLIIPISSKIRDSNDRSWLEFDGDWAYIRRLSVPKMVTHLACLAGKRPINKSVPNSRNAKKSDKQRRATCSALINPLITCGEGKEKSNYLLICISPVQRCKVLIKKHNHRLTLLLLSSSGTLERFLVAGQNYFFNMLDFK